MSSPSSTAHLLHFSDFLSEKLSDQTDKTPFAPRCIKDLIEERLFERRRDLFTSLDLVFFDTTSIYFEGNGGEPTLSFGSRATAVASAARILWGFSTRRP